MDKLKNGIIEVDGIVLGKDTTLEDLQNIGIDKATQRFHGNQYLELLFNKPIESDGVTFNISVRVSQKDDSKVILIDPRLNNTFKNLVDESRAKQEVCEEWLKRNMDVPPTRDTNGGIVYEFDWGDLYSASVEHINFGHMEGCIQLVYGGKLL